MLSFNSNYLISRMERAIAIPEALLAELTQTTCTGESKIDEDDDTSSIGSDDSWDDYFTFEIEIGTDPSPTNVALQIAHHDATVVKVTSGPIYRYSSQGNYREITGSELDSIAHPYSQITLCFSSQTKTEEATSLVPLTLKECYSAKNGVYFTLSDLVETIVKFETKARNHRRIGGLIDLTHVHFRSLIPLNRVDDGDLQEFEICFD